jgi:hypothetical protein
MTWQPIETAPTEGRFLVFGGMIETELGMPEPSPGPVLVEMFPYSKQFGAADVCYYGVWVNNPTHWAPIPEAPA